MTDWRAEIERHEAILEQLELEVHPALQGGELDLARATALFQELDKQARAWDQIAINMRNLFAPEAELAAAERLGDRFDALVRAAAAKMMALRGQ